MKLISLPDCKKYHPLLTLNKEYEILGVIGNAYKIQPEGCEEQIWILQSRLEK